MRDGLSQNKRIRRIDNAKNISIINNRIDRLIPQARQIATFIRYYNLQNEADGYFDQFLNTLAEIESMGIENYVPDGNMEPSQAVLFYFIKQLHTLTSQFNRRWSHFAQWYVDSVLQIKPIKCGNPKVSLRLLKTTKDLLKIDKGFGFVVKNNSPTPMVYRLTEDVVLENVSIAKILVIHLSKQKNIHPASILNFVTSLRIFDLPGNAGNAANSFMFDDNNIQSYSKKLGFMISSPSLLLREGKRTVMLHLKLENDISIHQYIDNLENNKHFKNNIDFETLKYLVTNNIFFIKISTANGWETINEYLIKKEEKTLSIKFSLSENFPATTACNADNHNFESMYPAVKIHLNTDAWLYPYSWLKPILLRKIVIQTSVKNINNVLVYNDLGKVDCSKPFTPFGINTEKGAWLTIGNYEMAIKNTQLINVKIDWEQLPANNDGLYGYYKEYRKNIDNQSFKITASYLSDYQWKEISNHYLFNTVHSTGIPYPIAPLSKQSTLKSIDIEKMPSIKVDEDNYEYNIHAKTGFINFSLCKPDIGFGEKHYRSIFTEHLMSTIKRKRGVNTPNAPISPLIDRLTLNYTSEDVINLHAHSSENNTSFFHISPFGHHQIYPNNENSSIPLIYTMDTDSNILLKLTDVRKGCILNLYFDFLPNKQKITRNRIPQVKWYFGKVYQWEQITDAYIWEDNTRNLLVSGLVKIKVCDYLNNLLFDENGCIWLRIGIEKNEEVISDIRQIYLNVVEAELEPEISNPNYDNYPITGELDTESNFAGLSGFDVIEFYGGREKEKNDEQLVRISEFISHRGKAVTIRDFERITLQEFPEIKKTKCFPCNTNDGIITLVVIPDKSDIDTDVDTVWEPKATSRQLLKIEQFLALCASERIKNINVINPLYEEVRVRCQISFNAHHSTAACCAQLTVLLNKTIAPWQQKYRLPKFDYTLNLNAIWKMIEKQVFVDIINSLSIIVITSTKDECYTINEYNETNTIIKPSTSYSFFVPAKEHIIFTEPSSQFGVSEMAVDDSFIIQ